MPLISHSTYHGPSPYLFNGHLETVYPGVFRKIPNVTYERERVTTPDDDFLDVDWIDKKSKRLLILTHGLEGSTDRHYIKAPARLFSENGWDVLAWNCRSCSGEMNRQLRLYNHGDLDDISTIVEYALQQKNYERVVMVGFSMGGAITLNYLGRKAAEVPDVIDRAVAFSTPCDLGDSISALEAGENWLYRNRFRYSLQQKIEEKAKLFPDKIDVRKFKQIKEWKDFDNLFSAPLNGYRDADDFYHQASSIYAIPNIKVKSLIVNAWNDPLLTPACYPKELCERSKTVYLETPKRGGHVGFTERGKLFAWSEQRALEWCTGL
ncbi:MAG: YheT family hydrolase [Saprospiraceae bacterium]